MLAFVCGYGFVCIHIDESLEISCDNFYVLLLVYRYIFLKPVFVISTHDTFECSIRCEWCWFFYLHVRVFVVHVFVHSWHLILTRSDTLNLPDLFCPVIFKSVYVFISLG